MENGKRKKLVSIQSLRALAFIGILCQHCSVARLGTWGVSVFFVLSGFILTFTSLQGGKSLPVNTLGGVFFSASKIKKLYATHAATALAVLLLILYSMHVDGILSQWPRQALYLAANLLLVQDWFPAEEIRCSLNGVAWYLSAMTFLYFTFPFFFHHIKKYKSYKSGLTVLGCTYILQIIITALIRNTSCSYYLTYFFPLYRCFDFFAGCNVGYLYYSVKNVHNAIDLPSLCNGKSSIKYTLYEIMVILFTVVTVYIHWNITGGMEWINNSLLYLPSSCALVYIFACGHGKITRFLSNKALVRLGDISGYTFLIHQAVLYYFQAVYYKLSGKYAASLSQMIVVFLLTVVSTKLWIAVLACFRR